MGTLNLAVSPAETTERPTLRSILPRGAECRDKYGELEARAVEIESDLAILVPKLREAGVFSAANNIAAPPAPPEREPPEKVVSLLNHLMPKREPARPAPKPYESDKARALALSAELDAIREAQKLLLPEINRARTEGSIALCRALTLEYQIVADRVCGALLALGEAALENERWLNDLRKQGVTISHLRPVLCSFNDFSDPVAELRRLLDWAAENGWFDRTKIPESWRVRS